MTKQERGIIKPLNGKEKTMTNLEKSKERLAWELEYDCVTKMRQWILDNKIVSEEELVEQEANSEKEVKEAKKQAWISFTSEIKRPSNSFSWCIKIFVREKNVTAILAETLSSEYVLHF